MVRVPRPLCRCFVTTVAMVVSRGIPNRHGCTVISTQSVDQAAAISVGLNSDVGRRRGSATNFRGIRCVTFREFPPARDPPTPQKLESIFVLVFCSIDFGRDRHCHGTRKCPHRLSCDKLIRVVVPSQLRVSLHAWRFSRRFQNASELWRRCSTPQHHIQDLTNTHTNISNRYSNRATHHKNRTRSRRSMEEDDDGVVPGWPDFSNLVLLPNNVRVQLMFDV